jgi:serine/threonine-protein kinase RsbW
MASAAKKLSIPSTLEEVAKVRRAIIADATAAGYGELALFAIQLALDEALSNAVNHGNGGDSSKKVNVEYSVDDERASVCITDQGPGFDPNELPDPTADENLEHPHGRGVMLMRAYMTEVSFNKKGNAVTLVKRKTCRLH